MNAPLLEVTLKKQSPSRRPAGRRPARLCRQTAYTFLDQQRRDAGTGRRIRLRANPRSAAPSCGCQTSPTGEVISTARHRQHAGRQVAHAAAAHAGGVPGPVRMPQSANAGARTSWPSRSAIRHGGAARSCTARSSGCWTGADCRATPHRLPHEFSGGQRQRIAHRPGARAAPD